MMMIEVNGQPFGNFIQASAELRLDALTSTFAFQASSNRGNLLPFKENIPCKILIDDEIIITGFIEVIDIDYSANTHNISIQGRGKTSSLIDSTLDALSDIRPPIGLKSIIEKVIDQIGLDIKVIELISTEQFNEAEDLAGPDPGEKAFSFIEKFSRKRQVLLRENKDGDILIVKPSLSSINSPLKNIIGGSDNNILSGNVSYDHTNRYNKYKFVSAQNPIALINAGETNLTSLVNQGDGVLDPLSRVGRQLILVSEGPYSSEQCRKRALWEANIRKTRGTMAAVTVDGFRTLEGKLWEINTLVSVVDEFSGIDATMLVNSVTYDYNNTDGSLTTLTLVPSNAYTLDLSEPKVDKVGLF